MLAVIFILFTSKKNMTKKFTNFLENKKIDLSQLITIPLHEVFHSIKNDPAKKQNILDHTGSNYVKKLDNLLNI
mgnify:CR=1 FL=1